MLTGKRVVEQHTNVSYLKCIILYHKFMPLNLNGGVKLFKTNHEIAPCFPTNLSTNPMCMFFVPPCGLYCFL